MNFSLDRLWELARDADREALALYNRSKWSDFHEVIRFRNMMMRLIFEHPTNIYSYMAIMCRTISGLSGSEDQLKVEKPILNTLRL